MMFVEKNIFNYLFMTQITANCNVSISLFIYDQDKSNVLIQLIYDFFQTDAQKALHYIGAGLAFGLGTVYCFVQTRLSWKLKSNNIGNRYIAIAQLINSIALTVLLVTCILYMMSTNKIKYSIKHI